MKGYPFQTHRTDFDFMKGYPFQTHRTDFDFMKGQGMYRYDIPFKPTAQTSILYRTKD